MDSYEKTGYLTKPYKMFHITDKSKLDIPFHYHDFHKILIHIKGNVSYCIEGRNYKLQPYDIVLVNAGEVHRPILNDDSIYERIIIYISKNFANENILYFDDDLTICFRKASACQSHVLRFSPIDKSPIWHSIKQLYNSFDDTGYANELYHKLVFLEFMIQLNRISISGGTQYIDTYSSNEKIVEIIDYLNHNLTKELSIDNISDRFFMSRYYLMHSFKEATGYTIGNYVSTKRLLLARDLIQNGTPVKTACYECGFKSYSAFIRAYKKSFDTLPSASFPY